MARKKRDVPEINASSMADIAFLLLIFFLVTTTFDSDYAIERRLPQKLDNELQTPEEVKQRNLFILLINKNDELFVNGERGDMVKLKEDVKRFILNPTNDPNLSEKSPSFVQSELLKGVFYRSKGVVTLQADRLTTYKKYIAVQGILTDAFEELRDAASRKEFNLTYEELKEKATKGTDEEVKKKHAEMMAAIDAVYPVAISEAETRKSAAK